MKDAMIHVWTNEPDYSRLPDQEFNWAQTTYGNISEILPNDAPPLLGKYVMFMHYFDANLSHDMLTGHSVMGILHLMNKTPIKWYSEKQVTIEIATYGSEFITACMCIDQQVINLCTMLCYLGIPIHETSYMFRDNKTVVDTSSTIPHAKLHKHHNALSFHHIHEAVTAKFMLIFHLSGEFNPADIMTKHWGYPQIWRLLQPILFYQGDTAELFED
jgi:hypothetical protein